MSDLVLTVDDNRDAADLLAELVRHFGHDALAVYDGAEAIRQAAQRSPDMVLLDLAMPGMDGFEVASGIRRQAGGSHTVIVAVTGLCGERAKRQAFEAGCDLYVTKPISLDHLRELLGILAPADTRGQLTAIS